MTRIPYVRREELGPEGQQLWDAIVSGRGDLVVTAGGGLAGPFNAFVTAPGAGRRLSSLGATLRFGTSIERRLSEIAIITIGAVAGGVRVVGARADGARARRRRRGGGRDRARRGSAVRGGRR
ncbi:MAG: hypothetical protein ACRDOE_23115, partial [Streptosporangiaceae bacterium]